MMGWEIKGLGNKSGRRKPPLFLRVLFVAANLAAGSRPGACKKKTRTWRVFVFPGELSARGVAACPSRHPTLRRPADSS